jgi:hypothetical protein
MKLDECSFKSGNWFETARLPRRALVCATLDITFDYFDCCHGCDAIPSSFSAAAPLDASSASLIFMCSRWRSADLSLQSRSTVEMRPNLNIGQMFKSKSSN